MHFPVQSTLPTICAPSSYLLDFISKPEQNEVVRMDGKWVFLSDGRKILDASGGAGVSCIGANDHRVNYAIYKQLQTGVAYAAPLDFVTRPARALQEYLAATTNNDLIHMEAYGSGTPHLDYSGQH